MGCTCHTVCTIRIAVACICILWFRVAYPCTWWKAGSFLLKTGFLLFCFKLCRFRGFLVLSLRFLDVNRTMCNAAQVSGWRLLLIILRGSIRRQLGGFRLGPSPMLVILVWDSLPFHQGGLKQTNQTHKNIWSFQISLWEIFPLRVRISLPIISGFYLNMLLVLGKTLASPWLKQQTWLKQRGGAQSKWCWRQFWSPARPSPPCLGFA